MDVDLTTQYGPLTLNTPIIAGACPLTAEEMLRVSMVSAGVGAIVLPSMFEEQVTVWNEDSGYCSAASPERNAHDQHVLQRALRMQAETVCETASSYLALVQRASSEISIPVIASLNGECDGVWDAFAVELAEAGADGIELHVRQPPPGKYLDPREIEDAIVETAECIAAEIEIPLFLKLGRNYTSMSQFAHRLKPAVSGLVLFGKSPHVDIDLESVRLKTSWALTPPGLIGSTLESLIRVHGHCPEMDLAASGGIDSSEDLIKVLLAGAEVAEITSAIYRNGPTVIGNMLEGLRGFLARQRLNRLKDLISNRPFEFDSDSERIEYVKAMTSTSDSCWERKETSTIEGDRYGHLRSPR